MREREIENRKRMTNHQPPPTNHLLMTQAPYALEATVRLLQRRPVNRVDRWVDGRYCRAVRTAAGMRLVRVWEAGSVEAPDLKMAVRGGPVGDEVVANTEETLDIRVQRRRRREAIAVETQTVLELEIAAALVRIAKRDGADRLAAALETRRQLARVHRRNVRLKVGK